MDKLKAILNLLRQGSEVSNAGAWKNAGAIANFLLALAAVAVAYGYKVDLSSEDAQTIGLGLVAFLGLANSVLHVITSQRAGLPPANPPAPSPEPPAQG